MSASRYVISSLLFALVSSSELALSAPQEAIAQNTSQESSPENSHAQIKQQIYESYKVNREIKIEMLPIRKLTPKANSKRTPPILPTVSLTIGMEVTIIETDNDPKFGDIIRIGTDSDGKSIPSDFWVRSNDLLKAGLEQSEISIDAVDPVLAEQDLETTPVLGPRDFNGSHNINILSTTRAMYGYRYVKQYLLRAGLVKLYLPGTAPSQAAHVLEEFGFKRTKRQARGSQLNDVCVYRGGNAGVGHVEIKLKEGWWYGYGYHDMTAVKGARLVGCYSKPGAKKSSSTTSHL